MEAEKREAGKEKNRAAAELELGKIDKDANGDISADEVCNIPSITSYFTISCTLLLILDLNKPFIVVGLAFDLADIYLVAAVGLRKVGRFSAAVRRSG